MTNQFEKIRQYYQSIVTVKDQPLSEVDRQHFFDYLCQVLIQDNNISELAAHDLAFDVTRAYKEVDPAVIEALVRIGDSLSDYLQSQLPQLSATAASRASLIRLSQVLITLETGLPQHGGPSQSR